jgi:hypothetical protein
MEDSEFDATLKKLSDQVSNFTSITVKSKPNPGSGFLSKFDVKSPLIYYCAVPIIIALVLFFWKPGFVMEEVSIDGNLPEKKLSFKKLLVGTVLITAIIAIVIFVYFYRNKNSDETA